MGFVGEGFQSHAGSIEAIIKVTDPKIVEAYFNPTLVRLRRLPGGLDGVEERKFQSHAGSIEAPLPDIQRALLEQFQSHAGSIEAQAEAVSKELRTYDFNPTLVRLRPASAGRALSFA